MAVGTEDKDIKDDFQTKEDEEMNQALMVSREADGIKVGGKGRKKESEVAFKTNIELI